MMGWLDIQCPGCRQKRSVSPGTKYKVCEKCATPHCIMESGSCKVKGCNGWLIERENPR